MSLVNVSFTLSPYHTMHFLYIALAFNPQANKTQIVILHLHVVFYFGKFGVLFTDSENISQKCNHDMCETET